MSPLVKQMLNTTVSNDVETRLLEDLFEQEVKCESDHSYNGDRCSNKVTARIYQKCGRNSMVCHNAEVIAEAAIILHSDDCGYCGSHLEDCWTIRPI